MKLPPHSDAVWGQLDSQAMVTEIWPQNKLSLIPFEVTCVCALLLRAFGQGSSHSNRKSRWEHRLKPLRGDFSQTVAGRLAHRTMSTAYTGAGLTFCVSVVWFHLASCNPVGFP